MGIKSPHPDISFPETDLLSYIFGDGTNVPETPQWIDAADKSKFLSLRSALEWIKWLGKGLQELGVKCESLS